MFLLWTGLRSNTWCFCLSYNFSFVRKVSYIAIIDALILYCSVFSPLLNVNDYFVKGFGNLTSLGMDCSSGMGYDSGSLHVDFSMPRMF